MEHKEINLEISVWVAIKRQNDIRVEECHGRHEFNDGEDKIKLSSFLMHLPNGKYFDISPLLSQESTQTIIDKLIESNGIR